MIQLAKIWLEMKFDRRAVTALEYGLIAAAIVGAIAAGVTSLGTSLSTKFATIGSSL